MRVLIIGAGTGGMCLAHGLRRAGVDVRVFERHRNRTDGLHGYRVGIDPTGSSSLFECLPPDLFALFAATCARTPGYFNVLTEDLGLTAAIALRPDPNAVAAERSVSRSTLRQVLLSGMDDVVDYGKELTHYDHGPDGVVTAHFTDGTSATGDLLVGADGSRSAVRRQLLPGAGVHDTGITAVATKTPLDPELRALLPHEVAEGLSLIFARHGLMGMLHVMEFPWSPDGTARDPRLAEQLRSRPGLVLDHDYVNLSIWSTHDHFPPDVHDLRGRELVEVALDATRDWHPVYRRLFELSDPQAAFPIRITTSAPVEAWDPTSVTLLGDAVHTMTPGHGVGANTALRDAALLARELVEVHRGEKGLIQAVGDYEAEMLPYGAARVAESLDNNGTSAADPLYAPGVRGRAALVMARRYFGLTSRVPALRRRFLEELETYRAPDLPHLGQSGVTGRDCPR